MKRLHVLPLEHKRLVFSANNASQETLVASHGNATTVEEGHVFLQGGESVGEASCNYRSHG